MRFRLRSFNIYCLLYESWILLGRAFVARTLFSRGRNRPCLSSDCFLRGGLSLNALVNHILNKFWPSTGDHALFSAAVLLLRKGLSSVVSVSSIRLHLDIDGFILLIVVLVFESSLHSLINIAFDWLLLLFLILMGRENRSIVDRTVINISGGLLERTHSGNTSCLSQIWLIGGQNSALSIEVAGQRV